MRVEIIKSSSNFIQLVLSNSSQQFVSLIRRYLTKKVKTIQILGIPQTHLNTFDNLEHNLDYSTDVIQGQIQNIALNFSPKQIQDFKKEDYVFKIDAFNDTVHNLMITTQDIQIFDKDGQRYSTNFIRSVFPPKPDFIHLFILQPNQLLKFTAHAAKSDSSTHAVFNHLSKPVVTPCVDDDIASKRLNQILADTPESDKKQVITDFNTTERFRCYPTDQFNQPFNFNLSFHTISSLSPTFALCSACSQAVTDIQDLIDNFKISSSDQDMFSFPIHHEISIGLFLQYIMAPDLYRVFNKNNFTYFESSSYLHTNSSTKNDELVGQFKSKTNLHTKKKSYNSTSNPISDSQFCLEFIAFDFNIHIFSFSYNQNSNISIDLAQSQIKSYLSKIIIQLNSFKTHFNQIL